jgi:hypothetical protein
MELYFSCLLRKQVNVREHPDGIEAHPVTDRLQVWFRPVVMKSCAISDCLPGKPPVTDMPLVRPERTSIAETGFLASEFRGTITLDTVTGDGLQTLDHNVFEFVERSA